MAVATDAVLVMVRAGTRTVTVAVHAGSVLPVGQVLPGSSETAVLTRRLSPRSGLLMVTVKVMVAVWPVARSPVQVSTGLAKETVPVVAAALLL